MRFPAYLTGRAAVLIWVPRFRPYFPQKPPDPEPRMDNTMPILLVPGLVSLAPDLRAR